MRRINRVGHTVPDARAASKHRLTVMIVTTAQTPEQFRDATPLGAECAEGFARCVIA